MRCDWCEKEAVRFMKATNEEEIANHLPPPAIEKTCSTHICDFGIEIEESEYVLHTIFHESKSVRYFTKM